MNTTLKFKTLVEFLEYFKDEDACLAYFASIRFRNGRYCPHCGCTRIYAFKDGKRYRCAKCQQDFTIKTKTVFGESKLPLKKWFVAIYLLTTHNKGISSVQLAKQIGVTQKTAWFMDHRIRSAMKQNKGKLFGTIEMDETYVGGLEKNKHSVKRVKGTQGRNHKTKTPVLGLIQRGGEVRATVAENCKMITIESHIIQHAKFGSQLYTDDFLSYGRIGKYYPHEVVKHAKGQYVRDGNIHSNSIESFWALFKRGYHGIYHHMSRKHLQRYVDEFSYRFNRRADSFQEIFSDLVEHVSTSAKLPYKELTIQPT